MLLITTYSALYLYPDPDLCTIVWEEELSRLYLYSILSDWLFHVKLGELNQSGREFDWIHGLDHIQPYIKFDKVFYKSIPSKIDLVE